MHPPSAGTEPPENVRLLKSHSLSMLVQRELERMILAGELAAGVKLDEAALSTQLGVSRGPVRESFRALEETGLVRTEKNRGVFVREISIEEADDIYEVRATFDQLAGRKLAQTITPAQLAEMRALLAAMEEATKAGDLERYHPLNLRFHDTLVGFANNPKLLQMYRRLVNELNLYRRHTLALRDRLPTSTKEHRRILDAIAGGDVEGAGRMLHDHAMASRVRMHTLPAAAASQPPAHPAAATRAAAAAAAAAKRAAPAASPSKTIDTRRATTPKPRVHVAERVIKA